MSPEPVIAEPEGPRASAQTGVACHAAQSRPESRSRVDIGHITGPRRACAQCSLVVQLPTGPVHVLYRRRCRGNTRRAFA